MHVPALVDHRLPLVLSRLPSQSRKLTTEQSKDLLPGLTFLAGESLLQPRTRVLDQLGVPRPLPQLPCIACPLPIERKMPLVQKRRVLT